MTTRGPFGKKPGPPIAGVKEDTVEGILGRKLGMTQVFDQEGNRIAVTVVEAGPCRIVERRTVGDAGAVHVQLAFEECRQKVLNRPKVGLFEKKGLKPHRHLREFSLTADHEDWKEGEELRVETLFRKGDHVDVSGTSKGRGFTGVMKRHNFKGAKASHGTHEYFRHGGSLGPSADPARVFKGVKMPGQHGNARVTVQNLEVVQVIPDKNLLLIRGAVPGPNKGLVEVRAAVKKNARAAEQL